MSANAAPPPGNPPVSLRDYFAGQALTALIIREAIERSASPDNMLFLDHDSMADAAYRYADAMLKQAQK
jgi:hypothetical protein